MWFAEFEFQDFGGLLLIMWPAYCYIFGIWITRLWWTLADHVTCLLLYLLWVLRFWRAPADHVTCLLLYLLCLSFKILARSCWSCDLLTALSSVFELQDYGGLLLIMWPAYCYIFFEFQDFGGLLLSWVTKFWRYKKEIIRNKLYCHRLLFLFWMFIIIDFKIIWIMKPFSFQISGT